MASIRIACKGSDTAKYQDLTPFQGNLKNLSKANYEKLKKEILELGFSSPIHIWHHKGKKFILDGHQRLRTVKNMVEVDGTKCPDLPVVDVEARSYQEAKRKVLALTSQYGEMTDEGLYEFIQDTDMSVEEMDDNFRFPEINLDMFKDSYGEKQIEGEETEASETDDDAADEIPEHVEPRCKAGETWKLGRHQLFVGDSKSMITGLLPNTVDAVVTDPPYGLEFMGKKWDYDVPGVELWAAAAAALKPGAHLLSFGGTRTYHRMAVNVEDAGFEIRDQLQWLYGSGFPKSHDISKAIDKEAGVERDVVGKCRSGISSRSRDGEFIGGTAIESEKHINLTAPATDEAKQYSGFGTALKPANEPIVLARKPISEKTVAANVLKWGVGGLNIDGCRVELNGRLKDTGNPNRIGAKSGTATAFDTASNYNPEQGRFPANVLLDERAAGMLDEQSGNVKSSRFFYVAKASRSERNSGCEELVTWENQDQNQAGLTERLNQMRTAISGDITQSPNGLDWSMFWSGSNITDRCQADITCTIEMVISWITESKISNASHCLSINGYMEDVTGLTTELGLSLAEIVDSINQSIKNTTNEKTVSVLGAVNAVLTTLLKIKGSVKRGNWHNTIKPIKLMEYLCKLIVPIGGTVLEPFAGSGTTLLAAEKLELTCIAAELEPEHCDIILARWESLTGEKAVKHGG